MRRRVVALLLALGGSASAAEPCTKDGLLFFPAPGAVVPTNVQFLLEGVGEGQAQVQALLSARAIALLPAQGEPIEVKAEKGYLSAMARVAIRLRPLRALEPGTEYTLALPPELAGVRLINDRLGDGTLRWLAGAGPDKKAPRYKQRPASSEGAWEKTKDGGVVRFLKLRTVLEETSPAWVLITMQRARGGSSKQVYPAAVEGGTIVVGHDACSGNFSFEDGRAYKLGFELFDAAGNRGTDSHTLEVAAPRPPL